jgi:hypothetical protein
MPQGKGRNGETETVRIGSMILASPDDRASAAVDLTWLAPRAGRMDIRDETKTDDRLKLLAERNELLRGIEDLRRRLEAVDRTLA